ncbi:MAG: GHMP kinase [Gammaproteobacteria bacterium]|nr:MAG: GHMP kinase [Gammaproteobacteria bacterium]
MQNHNKTPKFQLVQVEAPARLHLGFLDLNGNLGRRFGGLGLTLEGIATELEITQARSLLVEGPDTARVRAHDFAASLLETLELPPGVAIRIKRAIPDHIGLGSGTQLALAVATGLLVLYGIDMDLRKLAGLMMRGMRSGIGIGAFESGGFLVDGGNGGNDRPPPVIMQENFPDDWRVLLIFDRRGPGIHGKEEVSAFAALPEFPASQAAELCRLLLMQALPALAEQDHACFGRAIGRVQQVVGDYFSPAQSGRFSSPEVARVLAWLEAQEIHGIGQSSWGPTGFAILDSEAAGARMLQSARRRFSDRPMLHFELVRARNHGGRIDTRPDLHRGPLRAAM